MRQTSATCLLRIHTSGTRPAEQGGKMTALLF